MRLTRYSDFAMRLLLHLAERPDERCSIAAVAQAHGISQNHLMKVVSDLVGAGYVTSVRGRGGGIRLARPPQSINAGALLRHTEGVEAPVSCEGCLFLRGGCGYRAVLDEAMQAFVGVLDKYTLADLLKDSGRQKANRRRDAPDRPSC